jgi:hypothetical protein
MKLIMMRTTVELLQEKYPVKLEELTDQYPNLVVGEKYIEII